MAEKLDSFFPFLSPEQTRQALGRDEDGDDLLEDKLKADIMETQMADLDYETTN